MLFLGQGSLGRVEFRGLAGPLDGEMAKEALIRG